MFRAPNALSQKDLHRRIFLNTMRNVYPNSIQIAYVYDQPDEMFRLLPLTITHKCPAIKDKLWAEVLGKLHRIFLNHVQRRYKLMALTWTSLILLVLAYLLIGHFAHVMAALWYQ